MKRGTTGKEEVKSSGDPSKSVVVKIDSSSIGAVMLIELERLGEPSYSSSFFFFFSVEGNQEESMLILTDAAMTTYNLQGSRPT